MNALILLVSVLVTADGSSLKMTEFEESYPFQPQPVPVEIQFITQKVQNIKGDTPLQYHAPLCGGCSYDGLSALFAINLANVPWNVDLGTFFTVTAKDSAGNVLATNTIGGVPVPDFNFTYHAKYKDLYFDVKTGPYPAFIFTLSLSFAYNTTANSAMPCEPRWRMSPMEHAQFLNFSEGDDTANLEPIFKTHAKKVVPTLKQQFLRLDYCFGGGPHYNITITIVADDQKSGFASYACKKTYNGGKCNVLTPYRDISGGAANFIEIQRAEIVPRVFIVSGAAIERVIFWFLVFQLDAKEFEHF